MEAPPGPLRSPDGLYWWDGKVWQPIATLGVPPPVAAPGASVAGAVPAKEEAPSSGAWKPPAEIAQPAPLPPQPTQEVPRGGPWRGPPGPGAPPAAIISAPEPAPAWQPPPPAAGQSPPAAPPAAGAPWPDWLPRDERSEAVIEDVPTRAAHPAAKPPPAAPGPAPVQVAAGARPSSWLDQLYPATAVVNSNRRIAIYVGLGFLGLIALYIVFQALSQANLFGSGGTAADTGPVGTQFQQADGFLSGSLNPALASVATAVKTIRVDCQGTHSVTCRNTLEDSDLAMVKAISVIDRGTFPSCISASVVQTRRDLAIQEQALKAALIGFRTNNDDLISKGLADYAAAAPALKIDGDALKAVEQSACPKSN
jgi:hypothetical protein